MSQRLFIPFDEDSIENEQEFNLISMTALDYLKQVRFERRKIPQVVSVTRPHNSNLNDAVNEEIRSERKFSVVYDSSS